MVVVFFLPSLMPLGLDYGLVPTCMSEVPLSLCETIE